MSEFVGYRCERMIPEYELKKEKIKIFFDEEMRTIMKTKESYKYKIRKQAKSIKDYVEYIVYERRILNLVEEREQDRKDKMTSVQYAIANHIKGLYKEAMSLFLHERRLWDNFIKYCKHAKFTAENNTKLYLQFSRVMLLEAQKAHPDLNTAHNTESLQTIAIKRVKTVYKSSIKKIHNVNYTTNLLQIAEDFTFTTDFQKMIVTDMMFSFPREATTWHVLAQRELRGFYTCELRLDLTKEHKATIHLISIPLLSELYPSEIERNKYGFMQRTPKRTKMKTRESYEFKIRKQTKSIKDYVEYTAYERRILNLVDRAKSKGQNDKHSICNC